MSLGKTVEVQIVDDVIDSLEAIKTVGDAYNTNPVRVVRMLGNVMEVPERPAIIVTPLPSPRTHHCPNSLRRVNLRLAITCVIDLNSTEGWSSLDFAKMEEAIRHFTADAEKAVTLDHTRGGLALDTTIESVDIYDVTTLQPTAAGEVTIQIPFRHQTANPTLAQ